MNFEEIFALVREHLVREVELEPEKVTLDADLFDDLGLDSIDALDLLAFMEGRLGEDIPEEKLKSIRRVKDVVSVALETLLAKQTAQ